MSPTFPSTRAREHAAHPRQYRNSKGPSVIQLQRGDSAKVLKLLACSDLRTQNIEDLIDYIKRRQLNPDLIVYAGDDVARFRMTPGKNLFERLAALSRFGLIGVIGNDDGPAAHEHLSGKKVYDVHRATILIGKTAFIGLEGAPSNTHCLPIGDPLYTEAEIARHLNDRARSIPECDQIVVISHAPPHKVLDHSIRWADSYIGSTALRTFVRRDPRVELVICGHSHLNGGHWDRLDQAVVMNVASHDGPKDPIRLGTCEFRSRNAITAFTPWPLFSEVTRYDELSQINGIYPEHCEAFFDAGISTVAQLAATSPERIGELIGWTPRAAGRYAHLARSRHLNVPLAMASLICPPPPRFIFDIETDPYGGNKLCWCIGVLDEATGDFVQFVATSEEEESRMLGEFLEWCTTARPGGLVAYSGSDFDKRNLICRLQAHGLSIPKILEESVDLLEPVRKALAVPIPSYQLKALAELLGFSFRHSDLEGFEVGSLALRAIRSRRRIPRKLLEYNEDDVRSTAHIIAEVERICGFAHAASRTRRTTRTARQGAGRMAKA